MRDEYIGLVITIIGTVVLGMGISFMDWSPNRDRTNQLRLALGSIKHGN